MIKQTLFLLSTLIIYSGFSPTFAVIGCLRKMPDLVPESDAIAQGIVTEISKIDLGKCPVADLKVCIETAKQKHTSRERWDINSAEYKKCRAVLDYGRWGKGWRIVVQVEKNLKNSVPQRLEVYVASPLLNLQCDDVRNLSGWIRGRRVLLFLENDAGRYWSIYGPHSIYSYDKTENSAFKDDLKVIEGALTDSAFGNLKQ